MGAELGESMRNAIAMVICTVIIGVVIAVVTISRNHARTYEQKLSEEMAMDAYTELIVMGQYNGDIPVPMIVDAIEAAGGPAGLAEFILDIDGDKYEDSEFLKNYFGRQLYVFTVERTDGIHLWVGDANGVRRRD